MSLLLYRFKIILIYTNLMQMILFLIGSHTLNLSKLLRNRSQPHRSLRLFLKRSILLRTSLCLWIYWMCPMRLWLRNHSMCMHSLIFKTAAAFFFVVKLLLHRIQSVSILHCLQLSAFTHFSHHILSVLFLLLYFFCCFQVFFLVIFHF